VLISGQLNFVRDRRNSIVCLFKILGDMAAFLVRQNLSRGELRLYLSNRNGYAQDAFSVKWTVRSADGTQASGESLTAIRARCGEYYAPWHTDVRNGSYRITWEIQEVSGGSTEIVSEGFFVVDPSSYVKCSPPSGDAIPVEGFATFLTGTMLGRGDLPLFLKDDSGYPQNAYAVFWTILDPIGRPTGSRTSATSAAPGEYYAQWPVMVGSGDYTILWEYQQDQNSPMQSAKMRFSVIYPAAPFIIVVIDQCPGKPTICVPATSSSSFVVIPQMLSLTCEEPIGRCGGVIVINNYPSPFPPSFPPVPSPPSGDCCGFEIARSIHLPTTPLPPAGNFTNQQYYQIPQRVRHVTFYVTYSRGAVGGYASLRLMWGNGTEEIQETLLDLDYATFNQYSIQNLSLQEFEGPIPPDNSPVNFMIEAGVPGGSTTVRLIATEGGVPGSPGTIGITLTASST